MRKSQVVEQKMIVIGRITSIAEGTGAAEGKALKVTLSGKCWNGKENADESITITFWNERAERARKCLKEGSFIMVDVFVKDGDTLYGNDFCFKGMYEIEVNGNRIVYILGYPSRKENDGKVRYSVAVDSYNADTRTNETNWIGINWSSKIKENAEKVLVPNKENKMPLTIIEGYAPEITEKDGNIYLNSVGYAFEVCR